MKNNFKRKSDTLMNPGATTEEIKCDYIVAPLDGLALKMDRKWGIDRLPELVAVETAARYGRAMAAMTQAMRDCDQDDLVKHTNNCRRGLLAMDQEAEDNGSARATSDVVEYDFEGFKFGIMPDDRNWRTEQDARPDLTMYTMREIAVLLRAYVQSNKMVDAAKKLGGAEIIRISERASFPNDEIPF